MIAIKSKKEVVYDVLTNEQDFIYRSFRDIVFNNHKGFWMISVFSFVIKESDVVVSQDEDGNDVMGKQSDMQTIQEVLLPMTLEEGEAFFDEAKDLVLGDDFSEYFKTLIITIIEKDTAEKGYFGLSLEDYEIVEI